MRVVVDNNLLGNRDGAQPLLGGSDPTRSGSDRIDRKSVTLSPDTHDQLRLKEDKFSEQRRIRVQDASTPDAMRRISKEYNHQGAGFITPRTRYRKDRGSLCGLDLSLYPAFGTYINMTSSFIGGGIMGLPLAFERKHARALPRLLVCSIWRESICEHVEGGSWRWTWKLRCANEFACGGEKKVE